LQLSAAVKTHFGNCTLFSYGWSTMNAATHDRFQKVTNPTNGSGATGYTESGERFISVNAYE